MKRSQCFRHHRRCCSRLEQRYWLLFRIRRVDFELLHRRSRKIDSECCYRNLEERDVSKGHDQKLIRKPDAPNNIKARTKKMRCHDAGRKFASPIHRGSCCPPHWTTGVDVGGDFTVAKKSNMQQATGIVLESWAMKHPREGILEGKMSQKSSIDSITYLRQSRSHWRCCCQTSHRQYCWCHHRRMRSRFQSLDCRRSRVRETGFLWRALAIPCRRRRYR